MIIKIIRLPLKINYRRMSPIIFLALATLLFISPAVIKQGYYAPIDTIRLYGLFQNGAVPHNPVLTDVPVQFLPWLEQSDELLKNNEFPLWSRYAGGGLPLLANMQSAVLYPLSALFYFLNLKLALILSSFLKLFAIGLFTYLYLRALKISPLAAVIGGTAFMFAGFNVVWLLFPHVNVVFLLPAGLWLLEKYFQSQRTHYILWLSLALVLGLFGGHPETFFYILTVLVLYALGKLSVRVLNWRQRFVAAATLGAGGLLGAGLAAILLLPFFEYLRLSQTWITRGGPNNYSLPKLSAIVNIIPDLFGNPTLGVFFANFSNYNELAMGYMGVSLALLALIAVIRFYQQRLVQFYALLLLFCLAVVYRLPGIFEFITSLPFFSRAANHRLLLIASFCLVALGSYALNAILQKTIRFDNKIRIVAAIFVIATAALFIWQMRRLPPELGETVLAWQLIFFILFLANLILSLIVLGSARWRGFVFVFAFLVFLETGGHGMFYNTVTKPADFYPAPTAIAYLQKQRSTDYNKVFFYGWLFPPNLGTWYKINEVFDYDAMGLPGWEKFKGALNPFLAANNPMPDAAAVLAGLPNLQFIGAKFLVFPPSLGGKIMEKATERLHPVYKDKQAVIFSQPVLPRAYLLPTADNSEARAILSQLKNNINTQEWQPVRRLALQKNGNSIIAYNSPSPAYLVLNENYYPGWQATIDNGTTVKIEDGIGLKLIKVPAGEHEVKVVYWPKSFRLGAMISAFSFGLWLALFLLLRRKQLPAPAGLN